jgi:hypothetical protein
MCNIFPESETVPSNFVKKMAVPVWTYPWCYNAGEDPRAKFCS